MSLSGEPGWLVFVGVLVVLLALDAGLFHRSPRRASLREALAWSVFWVGVGIAFGVGIYVDGGSSTKAAHEAGLCYFTAWLVEKSLSVDNLFVIALIFTYFKVDRAIQHRVLFWGVIGAIATRALVIVCGLGLLARFEWMQLVFAGFLIYSGVRMWREEETFGDFSPDRNLFVRLARRLVPVSEEYHGASFFVRLPDEKRRQVLHATPLFIALLVVETADLVFAVDSIPAVLGVSRDPFVVITSNAFAILGLRAMYFVLAAFLERFHHLQEGVSVILVFVGARMIAEQCGYDWATHLTLLFIATVLVATVGISLWQERGGGQQRHASTDPP